MIDCRKIMAALVLAGCLLDMATAQENHPSAYDSVEVNGMTLAYRDIGDGPPLVLLHGFLGTGADWNPFLEKLASEYRLIVPDLRGHGRSINPSERFTHRELALDVFALLGHLDIERFAAIGTSMGAMTLLHASTIQPERLDAMVLVGGTPYLHESARVIYRSISPDSIPPERLDAMASQHLGGSEQVLKLMRQFRAYKDSYDDVNFTPAYLASIVTDTLIVHGDRDQFFPASMAFEMYDAIPNSYLWVVPNGQHTAPLQTERGREYFLETVLDFLEGNWNAPPPGES